MKIREILEDAAIGDTMSGNVGAVNNGFGTLVRRQESPTKKYKNSRKPGDQHLKPVESKDK